MLLVDDDDSVRQALRRGLLQSGLCVETAADGQQAKTLLRSRDFDWLVTDIVMPDCEGLELVQFARREQPAARIIAMSGGGGGRAENYLKMARLFGAAHVLPKPFVYSDLVAVLTGAAACRPTTPLPSPTPPAA